MAGAKPQKFLQKLFRKSQILHLPCKHTFSIMIFTVNNTEYCQVNSTVHNAIATNKSVLHKPFTNLPCFQKCPYCAGIKIF